MLLVRIKLKPGTRRQFLEMWKPLADYVRRVLGSLGKGTASERLEGKGGSCPEAPGQK